MDGEAMLKVSWEMGRLQKRRVLSRCFPVRCLLGNGGWSSPLEAGTVLRWGVTGVCTRGVRMGVGSWEMEQPATGLGPC